jgi:hypothetical protein
MKPLQSNTTSAYTLSLSHSVKTQNHEHGEIFLSYREVGLHSMHMCRGHFSKTRTANFFFFFFKLEPSLCVFTKYSKIWFGQNTTTKSILSSDSLLGKLEVERHNRKDWKHQYVYLPGNVNIVSANISCIWLNGLYNTTIQLSLLLQKSRTCLVSVEDGWHFPQNVPWFDNSEQWNVKIITQETALITSVSNILLT